MTNESSVEPGPLAGACTEARLQLLGRFALFVRGQPESLGIGCRRLLAALALRHGHAGRREIAELLWPEVTSARAAANLRSVLWRLQKCSLGVIDCTATDLRLCTHVQVDWEEAVALARKLVNPSASISDAELGAALEHSFHDDLLPEHCDEEWLAHEAEWFRQLRLHALEALSQRLTAVGWYGAAVDVAMRAVRADPYRESAHQTLIQAYLAEGNQHAARCQYHAYRDILGQDMGLKPTQQLTQLVHAA